MRFSSASLNITKWLGLLLLIGIIVGAGLFAKSILDDINGDTIVIATHTCSPNKDDCEVIINGQLVTLSLTSNAGNFHSGQMINTIVHSSFEDRSPVQISLQGKTMYMGENHFPLAADQQQNFVNSIHFPVCVTGRMTWQAVIKFDNNDSVIFEFDAE